MNEDVNNPEGNENLPAANTENAAYMPKEQVPAEETPVTSQTDTPTQSYGFERQNSDLLWIAQKVSDVRTELSKFVICLLYTSPSPRDRG